MWRGVMRPLPAPMDERSTRGTAPVAESRIAETTSQAIRASVTSDHDQIGVNVLRHSRDLFVPRANRHLHIHQSAKGLAKDALPECVAHRR